MHAHQRAQHSLAVASGLLSHALSDDEEPSVVLEKLESFAFSFLRKLVFGEQPCGITLIRRTEANAAEQVGDGAIVLGDMMTFRGLNEKSAAVLARHLKLMSAIHHLLLTGRRISQRELFYLLIESFDNQQQLNEVVLDVSASLAVPRYALNIGAATRGVLAGCLQIGACGSTSYVDCRHVGTNGWPIPGDILSAVSVVLSSTARYIIVIEKFGIFNRLVQDKFYDKLPAILICGKGYPSVATRAMTSLLAKRLSMFADRRIPVIGIADFNPHGLALLQCYCQGSIRSSIEGSRFICNVRWLGLRSCHIQEYAYFGLNGEALTRRDLTVVEGLKRRNCKIREDARYLKETQAMEAMGKYELQWLYGHQEGTRFLQTFLLDAILRSDYI